MMVLMHDKVNLVKTVYAALLTSLVFVGTQFIRVPLPFGYFHMGDCFVILSAVILCAPYGVVAAAAGSVLADILSGYAIYAPATILIKSLMVITILLMQKIGQTKDQTIKGWCLTAGVVLAELVMVLGYFVYDTVLYRLAGAVAALPGNLLQGVAGTTVGLTVVFVMHRSGLLKYIKNL